MMWRCGYPATALLLVTLNSPAWAGQTGDPVPSVERREAAGRSAQGAVPACRRVSAHDGLATPEAAIRLYIESLAANDFACALQAYAVEHAARVDFTTLLSWVGVFSTDAQMAPAEYPMFVEMNELRAKAEMAQATKFLVYSLLNDADPAASQKVTSPAEIHAFIQAVTPRGSLR